MHKFYPAKNDPKNYKNLDILRLCTKESCKYNSCKKRQDCDVVVVVFVQDLGLGHKVLNFISIHFGDGSLC